MEFFLFYKICKQLTVSRNVNIEIICKYLKTRNKIADITGIPKPIPSPTPSFTLFEST